MIQLQKYFNSSSSNLQHTSLTNIRKNQIKAPSRRLLKSISQQKAKCEFQIRQQQNVKKAQSRYEQIMKKIREPNKMESPFNRYSLQNERKEVVNYIKLKSHRKQRMETDRSNHKHEKLRIQDQENEGKKQLSRSNIQTQRSQNENPYQRKRTTRAESVLKNNQRTFYMKPKTTILKKIINAYHLKQVRQIINSGAEKRMQAQLSKKENIFEVKCSEQAIEHIRVQYDEQPQKKQKKVKNEAKISKLANLKNNQGQDIAGWTIKSLLNDNIQQ